MIEITEPAPSSKNPKINEFLLFAFDFYLARGTYQVKFVSSRVAHGQAFEFFFPVFYFLEFAEKCGIYQNYTYVQCAFAQCQGPYYFLS